MIRDWKTKDATTDPMPNDQGTANSSPPASPSTQPDLSLYLVCLSPGKKKIKAAVGEKNPKQILILPVKWLKVMRLISREWGHSVSSLAHNFQSSDPNVLSRALIIICNCSMKRAISLQWNTLSTSGWASTTNLFPRDQLKWAITIFSFLNNSLNGRIIKKWSLQVRKTQFQLGIGINKCEAGKRRNKHS